MIRRRHVLGGAGLAATGLLGVGCASSLPAGLEVHELSWLDAQRDRPVLVRLTLPADANLVTPRPLVVISPGIGSNRYGYSYLAGGLAQRGWACLNLEHVGSNRQVWWGNPWGLVDRLQHAARDEEALARVQDLRFALDQVLASPTWRGRLDASRVVGAGHSYGANTLMLAAGAGVKREGRALSLREPRLKAVVLMSAPPFYGETDLPAVVGGISVPNLHITTTEDEIKIPGYLSPVKDRLDLFERMGGSRKGLLVFKGGSHSIFTDRSAPGGFAHNAQVKAATTEISHLWLSAALQGQAPGADALKAWRSQHAAAVERLEL
ncbi:alpha/beta hydrolase family protein [Ideonella sp.]|uniref:alpha/beta hydrolase family protein n=1 Tax=Ideonella sp. TaxID=1929293 RepID=UPI0037BF0FB0